MKKYLYLIFVCLLFINCTPKQYKLTYLDGHIDTIHYYHLSEAEWSKYRNDSVIKYEVINPKESVGQIDVNSDTYKITIFSILIILLILWIFIAINRYSENSILSFKRKSKYIWCTKSNKEYFIEGNRYEIIKKKRNYIEIENSGHPDIILKDSDKSLYYPLIIGRNLHDKTSITFSRTNPNEQINNMPGRCSHGGFNGTIPAKPIKKLKNMSLLNKIIIYVMKIGIIIILIKVFLILIQQIPTILNNLLLQWKI